MSKGNLGKYSLDDAPVNTALQEGNTTNAGGSYHVVKAKLGEMEKPGAYHPPAMKVLLEEGKTRQPKI